MLTRLVTFWMHQFSAGQIQTGVRRVPYVSCLQVEPKVPPGYVTRLTDAYPVLQFIARRGGCLIWSPFGFIGHLQVMYLPAR